MFRKVNQMRPSVVALLGLSFCALPPPLWAETKTDPAAEAPAAPPAKAAALTDSQTEAPPAPSLPAITVSKVERRDLQDRILASGLIAPVEEVMVQPLIEGQPIEALFADVGDLVETGQVLAKLSNSTLELQRSQQLASLAAAKSTIAQAEAQLVEAEASAAEAERTAERTRRLRDQGSASQAATDTANANSVAATARVTVARQSLEAARAQVALGEAQLANVELMLTRSEVKAPYSGKVTARNATIGAIASGAGQPMFVLEKDGALELRAEVTETDILRLAPGQKAAIALPGIDLALSGTVRLVEPSIDATTRLGRARVALDDPGALRAGMFVEATIIIAEREGLSVPVTAIGSTDGKPSVLRVEQDGLVTAVPVSLGIRNGGQVEILEGLAEGEQVVTKAAAFVRAGEKVNPVAETAAPAPLN